MRDAKQGISLEKKVGKKLADEIKKKQSEKLQGNKNLLGHKHTTETKMKMSMSHKGKSKKKYKVIIDNLEKIVESAKQYCNQNKLNYNCFIKAANTGKPYRGLLVSKI